KVIVVTALRQPSVPSEGWCHAESNRSTPAEGSTIHSSTTGQSRASPNVATTRRAASGQLSLSARATVIAYCIARRLSARLWSVTSSAAPRICRTSPSTRLKGTRRLRSHRHSPEGRRTRYSLSMTWPSRAWRISSHSATSAGRSAGCTPTLLLRPDPAQGAGDDEQGHVDGPPAQLAHGGDPVEGGQGVIGEHEVEGVLLDGPEEGLARVDAARVHGHALRLEGGLDQLGIGGIVL